MSIKIETVKTGSFEMDFFRFGYGKKPLAVIPGLSVQSVMGSADAIAEAYGSFGEEFTVYVFDRRKDMPPVYPVRDMARDTAEAFRALGLKDVYLFGASQGGMISLTIAIDNPDLIKKVAVGSTSAHVSDEQFQVIKGWIDLAKKGDKEGLYLNFGEEIYPPEVFKQYWDTLVQAAATVTDEDLKRFIIMAEGIKGFDVVDGLKNIKCPVLVTGVFEDSVLNSDATMEIAENLDFRNDFKLFMYTGYGHAAFDTAPDYHDRLWKFYTEKNIRYVFWDLDGTIIKSEGGVISSVKYALDKLGVTLPESELRRFIGPSLFDSFTNRAHLSAVDAETAIGYYREVYNVSGLFDAEVYDGVPGAMDELKKEGFKNVVVTSKPLQTAKRVLEHFKIDQYLETVVGPKPDDKSSDKEKLIRAALEYFGADKDEAVMIGDRCYDIDGANAVGTHSIGVLYGYGDEEELTASGAEMLAKTPADIPKIIMKMRG